MENSNMTHAEATDLKSFVHTEVERAVTSMIKWVVGLFIASILVTTSVVGFYTAVLTMGMQFIK